MSDLGNKFLSWGQDPYYIRNLFLQLEKRRSQIFKTFEK